MASGTDAIRLLLKHADIAVIADAVNLPICKLIKFARGEDDLTATALGDVVAILGSGELIYDHVNDRLRPYEGTIDQA